MTRPTACMVLLSAMLFSFPLYAQDAHRDKAVFSQHKNEFLDSIRVSMEKFRKEETPVQRELLLDFSAVHGPDSVGQFVSYWHSKPISQGLTGTCWCFSTTSFYESEIYRLTKRSIKLSEMYTVYWEYVEKARRYVQERGNSNFGEGSEANAVPRIWKKYGIVPEDTYNGLQKGQPFHDHETLFRELNDYLASMKKNSAWNEEETVGTVRSILDHHLGRPPEHVTVGGKNMTPQEYLAAVVRLSLDDYVEIMSLMEKPYFKQAEFEVPDNWWHSKEYYNVPLDDFMAVIKKSVRSGHTLCLGGDVSEPGYEGHVGVAVVPSFDIPPAYIDENARQFRFSNKTTGDDHGIHIVGYCEKDGKDWYLIKDSGSGSRNSKHPGYYFYHEDYVKLKMLGITVHREVVEDLLKKFQ